MLNIANHKGNANQNHNEISPHTSQNGYNQKVTNNKCLQWYGEKGTCVSCGGVKWWNHYEKQHGVSSKTKNRTTTATWSSNSISGYISEKYETTQKDTYTPVFIAK